MTVPTPAPILASNNNAVVMPNIGFAKTNSAAVAPKRNQVKNACTNCQKACKKCDDARPCPRCEKYGIAESCVNSVRKERKKGIKRGPYKRRQKNTGEEKPKDQQAPVYQAATVPPPAALAGTTAAPTVPAPSDFGYPTQLSQYTSTYETYNYAAVYNPDGTNKEIIPGQYVLPVYSSYPAPILVNGNTTEVPAASEAASATSDAANNADTSEGANKQPLTPVPSTSNSSGTTSPSETHEEDERFTRLTQLCTAALRENKEAQNKAKECSKDTEHPAEELAAKEEA